MHINIVSIIVFFCKCNMIEMQLYGDYFYGVNENWSIQYALKIRSCSSGCPHLFEILEAILIDLVALKKKQGKLFFGILMFKSNLALVFDQQNTLCMAKPDTVNLVVLCMSRSSIME